MPVKADGQELLSCQSEQAGTQFAGRRIPGVDSAVGENTPRSEGHQRLAVSQPQQAAKVIVDAAEVVELLAGTRFPHQHAAGITATSEGPPIRRPAHMPNRMFVFLKGLL